MNAGQFQAYGIHTGTVQNTRLYELDTPVVDTREDAVRLGMAALEAHSFANRLHIVEGIVDPYNGVVYPEIVDEIDVPR
jgi:hypothetical protein